MITAIGCINELTDLGGDRVAAATPSHAGLDVCPLARESVEIVNRLDVQQRETEG
jgi:hypothetical protein